MLMVTGWQLLWWIDLSSLFYFSQMATFSKSMLMAIWWWLLTVVNCSTFLGPWFFQMATFSKKINADGHQVTVTVVNYSRLWVFFSGELSSDEMSVFQLYNYNIHHIHRQGIYNNISCSYIFIKTDHYCCSTSRICKQVRAKIVKTDQCHIHTSVIKSNRLNHKMETGLSTLPSNNSFSKIWHASETQNPSNARKGEQANKDSN